MHAYNISKFLFVLASFIGFSVLFLSMGGVF